MMPIVLNTGITYSLTMSIVEWFFSLIINFLSSYGYVAIFLLMTLESMMLPVPSEIVIPFGGYLASQGILNIFLVILMSSLGGLAGSLIAYYIGYFGGRKFLLKYGYYFLITPETLDRAERWFQKYGKISVFTTRLVPVIRTFISLPAGIAEMDIRTFSLYTFIGSFIWSSFLAYLGYTLGKNWDVVSHFFSGLDIYIIIAGLIILIYIGYRVYKSYKINKSKNL